jgi:hypothetical protein
MEENMRSVHILDAVRTWAGQAAFDDITAAIFDPETLVNVQKIMFKEIKRRMAMEKKKTGK